MTKKKPATKVADCTECEAKLVRVEKHFAELIETNRKQLDRLCLQERQLEQLRTIVRKLEGVMPK